MPGLFLDNLGPGPVFMHLPGKSVTGYDNISARESASRPNSVIVEYEHHACEPDGAIVARCRRRVVMKKKAR